MRSKGQNAERRTLKKVGARPQPSSGSLPGMPNDGILGDWLLEVKSTIRKSLGVKLEWLEELDENAIARGKRPAFILVFDGIDPTRTWVAVPLVEFERLQKGESKK